MQYNCLPGTGLWLSQISLGTMTFGGQTDEAESLRIMDYALAEGVNFVDTANIYNQGESEIITGKGLRGRRQDIILATKVRGRMGDDPNSEGLSRRNIMAAVDASLKRLACDYIDIYYLHQPDYKTPLEETLSTMADLVRAGKIRYVGVSNYAAWQLADIMAICARYGYPAPVITQNVYNLITRGIEPELIPCIKAHKLGLAVYNPLAGGLLSGKHRPGTPAAGTRFADNEMYYERYWSQANFKASQELGEIAAGNGLSLLELALRWPLGQPGVTSMIVGISSLAQLQENFAAWREGALPTQASASCDQLWQRLTGARFAYNR